MDIYLRGEIKNGDVPMEFMKLALSHLQAAEQLTSLMSDRKWSSNYYRGQVVSLLIFHSTELFLKGFILKLAPKEKVNGHSLASLGKKLNHLAPDIQFDPPFNVDALVPYPELVRQAAEREKRFHQVFRYPIDTNGEPWPGVRGFSVPSCRRLLEAVRRDCERAYEQIFEKTG